MATEVPETGSPGASGNDVDRLGERFAAVESRIAELDRRGETDPEAVSRLREELAGLTLSILGPTEDEEVRAAVIAYQHAFLRRMIRNVDLLLERVVARLAEGDECTEGRAAAVVMLDNVERGLRLHFEHEELDGSVVRALEVAPRYHRRADSLHAEHRQLLAFAADLHRHALRAEHSAQRWHSVRDAFRNLRDAIGEHERAETEIIQSAWNDDIGGRG